MNNRTKRLPKSQRKFIRSQKALIRSQFSDSKKREELISDLYKKSTESIIEKPVEKKETPKPKKEKPKKENKKSK